MVPSSAWRSPGVAVDQLVKGSPPTVTHYGQPVTVTEDPIGDADPTWVRN